MKFRLNYFALAFGAMLLSGCGGSGLAGDTDDVDPLFPEIEEEFVPSGPTPPADAAVITGRQGALYDASGKPLMLRGANLQYADNPAAMIDGVAAIRDVGSNVIRVMLSPNTSALELTAVLNRAVENDMVVMLSLDLNQAATSSCQNIDGVLTNDANMIETTTQLWLRDWVSILANASYQPHIMINIANEWGPLNIFNANSIGYDEFIDSYKIMIRRFRESGFKVPLVIDAPHCGRDFNAFLGGRGRELAASDPDNNLVLAAHAFGNRWNSRSEIEFATSRLERENVPFVISEFGGSNVYGSGSVDINELMDLATGETALSLDLPWASQDDRVTYGKTFDTPRDFSPGAGFAFDAYIPAEYQQDGRLTLKFVLIDSQDRQAKMLVGTASQLPAASWSNVVREFTSLADFQEAPTDFDMTSVSRVGLEVSANNKSTDIGGLVKFDNLLVGVDDGGVSSALYMATFDNDLQNWRINEYGTGEPDDIAQENGVLTLLAPWTTDDNFTQLVYREIGNNQPPIDLTQPMTLSLDIFIPQEYASESGFALQFFFNDASSNFSGVGYTTLNSLDVGQWNTVSISITDLKSAAGYSAPNFNFDQPPGVFGVQVGGITSAKTQPLRFDNIQIIPPEPVQVLTVYENNFEFNDGWSIAFGAGDASSVSVENGYLQLLAPWGQDGQENNSAIAFSSVASLNPGVDFSETNTLRADVFIPESYANETGLTAQFFMLDNNYAGFAGFGWRSVSGGGGGIKIGEWQTFTVNVTPNDVPETFNTDQPPRVFGLQFSGIDGVKDEPILLDNIAIERIGGASVPANIVVDIPFANQAQVNELEVLDYAGIGWMESTLNDAKALDYSLQPFGWIAWSWFGSTEGEGGTVSEGGTVGILDLSESIDTAILTERGENIVYGDNGIIATGSDVEFQ